MRQWVGVNLTQYRRDEAEPSGMSWDRFHGPERTKPDEGGLRRTRADHVARRYRQSIQRNAIACLEKYAPLTNVEECRAVRPEHGFHSALLAMMPRWRFVRLPILYEMMALKIWYHAVCLQQHGNASIRKDSKRTV